MIKITYVTHDGLAHTVEAQPGRSVMEAAIQNGVPGIDADCGGACACATCHVYVEPDWMEAVGERSAMESAMLEFAEGVEDNSRLSCQLKISASLDGLRLHLPESQG
jgi:2Fe-2S ferredoxin